MTFLPKSCSDCGATFQPASGASKRCAGCRAIAGKKVEGEELTIALLERASRRAANGHSELQQMLVDARRDAQNHLQRVSTGRRRLDAVLACSTDGKDPSVVLAIARAAERRVEILEMAQGHLDRAEEYLAAMELIAADERTTK